MCHKIHAGHILPEVCVGLVGALLGPLSCSWHRQGQTKAPSQQLSSSSGASHYAAGILSQKDNWKQEVNRV